MTAIRPQRPAPALHVVTPITPSITHDEAFLSVGIEITGTALPRLVAAEFTVVPRHDGHHLIAIKRAGDTPIYVPFTEDERAGDFVRRLFGELCRASYPAPAPADDSEVGIPTILRGP